MAGMSRCRHSASGWARPNEHGREEIKIHKQVPRRVTAPRQLVLIIFAQTKTHCALALVRQLDWAVDACGRRGVSFFYRSFQFRWVGFLSFGDAFFDFPRSNAGRYSGGILGFAAPSR